MPIDEGSTEAGHVVAALRSGHDTLVPIVESLTEDQLTGPSAATEWDVSQVVSHLGSGAVISKAALDAALAGKPVPGMDANRAVWARWDAMTPQDRAAEFPVANQSLVAAYESLDAGTRQSLRIDLGFLPAPVDVATAARFRLSEFALHSWDVRVALDPAATVAPEAVPLLLPHAARMLSWAAKPEALPDRPVQVLVTLSDVGEQFGLTVGDQVTVGSPPADPAARLSLPAEAWLRLVAGRLRAEHTPAGVGLTGGVTLDELRKVFPGF
ncbi:MAG TPA: maleylpyruvate isomerase family mycothiol-dependent enzyme [Dermatophilaceae bacterium]|nr:maleylpyruvate isomerase family mycothiol-dependent enzyme [Dermatophilaceae bacterium]